MTQATVLALLKAEQAVEKVVYRRGINRVEFTRIVKEYQVLVRRATGVSFIQAETR